MAIDRNVHCRWVVLKGYSTRATRTMAAMTAGVLALAEVEHPSIVRIWPSAPRAVRRAGRLHRDGYVGGTSLKRILGY